MHPKIVQAILFLAAAGILGVVQWLLPAVPVTVPSPSHAVHRDEVGDLLAGDGSSYSAPNAELPPVAAPDDKQWTVASQQVFMDVRNDKIDAFLVLMSQSGVWITGLGGQSSTLHVTSLELSQDLHRHGTLYHAIFLNHRSGNFVVTPDGQARVLTLLLK